MNNLYLYNGVVRVVAVICMALLYAHRICAQQFPSTDENGQAKSYKLESASPMHQRMCLQDCTYGFHSVYDYRILPLCEQTLSQQWLLIPTGKDGCFRLKNCASGLYVSRNGTMVQSFYAINATSEEEASLFEFRRLSENQFAITYEDVGGDIHYLCVQDSIGGDKTEFSPNRLVDTRWAWYIRDGGVLTGIGALAHDSLRVSVDGRSILSDDGSLLIVFDLAGRKIASARGRTKPLPPGIYMVYTSQGVHRLALY